MDYIPAVGVVQAEFIYNWDGQTCENVLHYTKSGGVSQAEASSLAVRLVALWNLNIKGNIANNVSLVRVKMTDLTTQTGFVVNYSTGLPSAGTLSGASLPNNCALVLTKRTLYRGRSFRGRIYSPGLTETDVTANAVSGARTTALVDGWSNFINVVADTVPYDMCVVSRFANKLPRVTAEISDVVSLDSDGVVDSQRRRLPGRGG